MAEETTTAGPGLAYTSAVSAAGVWVTTPIDHRAVTDPRDRAICRALLNHALSLLDAEDKAAKANPVGFQA